MAPNSLDNLAVIVPRVRLAFSERDQLGSHHFLGDSFTPVSIEATFVQALRMLKLLSSGLPALLLIGCVSVPSLPATLPGPDFLARNAAAKGVITTPSGLQYFVMHSGPENGRLPAEGDVVTFDYEGKLVTGETFDSSFERGMPLTGRVDAFVPGFTEALKLMRPGDDWIVWVPPALGYGSRASAEIPANSVLRFRLVLRASAPAATPENV